MYVPVATLSLSFFILFVQETCNLNIENFTNGFTPLHLAAQRGYCRIIEALVGYGADVNASAGDGQTVLHLIFSHKDMQPPSEDTPEFAKVLWLVGRECIGGMEW